MSTRALVLTRVEVDDDELIEADAQRGTANGREVAGKVERGAEGSSSRWMAPRGEALLPILGHELPRNLGAGAATRDAVPIEALEGVEHGLADSLGRGRRDARRHRGSRHMQATVGPPAGAANSLTCTKPRRL